MQLSFNGNNQISTRGYQFDAAGNLLMDNVNCYTYDAENRIISVAALIPGSQSYGGACGVTAMSYVYDPDGRRVAKTLNGAVQKVNYYDAAGTMIAEKLNYMHNNPVTRRLVKQPGDWPYSSWRFYFLGDASLLAMDRIE